MANSLNTNPIYIDSTTGGTKAGQLHIKAIVWVSDEGSNLDIAADDDLLINDSHGNRIIGKRAEFAGDDLYFDPPGGLAVNGITVATMDGGNCYIYLY